MATKPSEARVDLDQLRPRLLALSKGQTELRARLTDYVNANPEISFSELARKIGTSRSTLARFLSDGLALAKSKSLSNISKFLDCEELGNELGAYADGIEDVYLSFASYSPKAIELALDITKLYRSYSGSYSLTEFASGFETQAETVLAVLVRSQSGLSALENGATHEAIRTLITTNLGHLEEHMKQAKQLESSERDAAAAELCALVNPLLDRFGGKTGLATALGISRGGLRNAMEGKSRLDQIRKLSGNIRDLTKQHLGDPTPGDSGSSRSSVGTPTAPIVANVPPELGALGGITTEAGVPYVLTEASFQQIEMVPLVALRDSLVTALRSARLLLNVASQLKDKTARKVLQDEVGHEIEELEAAIKVFSFAHPNRLLPLYDSQREVWKQPPTATRKGRT